MTAPRLTVLFSTIDERITHLLEKNLPSLPEVCYHIVWQRTKKLNDIEQKVNEALTRWHFELTPLEGKGLSRSRNQAISSVQTEFALFADDDVEYSEDNLKTVIHSFDENPSADILLFQMSDYEGKLIKNYSPTPYHYADAPKRTFISSCEIAFRKAAEIPFFDERFGIGSEYLVAGEEEVFIHSAVKKRLNIKYIPKVICQTDPLTTSLRLNETDEFWRSKGAVNCIINGMILATIKSAKYAFISPYLKAIHRFSQMIKGINYVLRTKYKHSNLK